MVSREDIFNDIYDSGTKSLGFRPNPRRATGTLHRNAITAADVVAAPANPTVADVTTGGALLANTAYYVGAVALSLQSGSAAIIGTSTVNASIQTVTTAADASNTHIVRVTLAAVTNADAYLIFVSTDAAPKMVAYVTEAQRAAGGRIRSVGVLSGDWDNTIATAVRTALTADANVGAFFTIGGSGADVTLTAKTKAANDATMDATIATGTAVGVTAASSANTTAGVAPVFQVETATIVGTITPGTAQVETATIVGTITPGTAQVETATVVGTITPGTAQVETATIVGTIDVAGAGNAEITVTASGLGGSPLVIGVAVANNDTASQVAGKVRTVLAANTNITAFFSVSGSGADVVLTRLAAAANDATMNIASANGTCTGLTAQATSANTTAGVAVGTGNATFTVTASGMANSPKAVSVAVVASDTASQVAGKARTALAADVDVGAFFAVSGASADVILTRASAAANDATLNLASDNGTCTGLTAQATSANTTAGVAPGTGNATITVTASGMTGTPQAVSVAVVAGDSAATVGGKVRTGLAANANVAAYFSVSGTGADAVLTRLAAAANDATMNIASDNGTCTGLTAQATSANTTAGVALGTGDATITVTANGMTGTPQAVSVAVVAADSATTVAGKVRTGLTNNANVGGFFTVSGSGADVVLTAKTAAANDATMNVASDNGTCTGLTAQATSANTTAGVAGTAQVETLTCAGEVTTGGNATVTVTAVGMTNTPKAVATPLVNTGTAGILDVGTAGTGLQTSNSIFALNTAHLPHKVAAVGAVSLPGYSSAYVHVRAKPSKTAVWTAAPLLNLLTWGKSSESSPDWFVLDEQTTTLLTKANDSLDQVYKVDVNGATSLVVTMPVLTGLASVDVWVEPV